jgi:purine-nucleoside phosphorylase
MKFKEFIRESKDNHAVLAFGRMNPPTIGHGKLVDKVKEIAKEHNASHHVVLSHSQDKTKNPL